MCRSFLPDKQDFSPANLTHFGYAAVVSDPDVAQGNVMYRLLMRAFPGWYEYNSVYALFPFVIPKENRVILRNLGVESQYSFDPPRKPQDQISFSTAANAKKILGDEQTFNVVWGKAILSLTGGVQYMLTGDRPSNNAQHAKVYKALYTEVPDGMKEVFDFYTKHTEKLLRERSYQLDNFYQVDVVREYSPMPNSLIAVYSTWFMSSLSVNSLIFL
jgi:hypothetical protein